MKRMLLASAGVMLVLSLLGVGNAQPVPKAAKEEMAKLQGTWKVVAAQMAGKEILPRGIAQVVVKGDRMALRADGKEVKAWSITVDPSRKPKAMDWIMGEEKAPLPAIYSLEGDDLRICFPLLPTKGQKAKVKITRPESFETKDKPFGLFVLKREKS
jgi:uncharacterized protein (TIGR03067 family)